MDSLRNVQFTYYLKNDEYKNVEPPKAGLFHKWIEEKDTSNSSFATTFALVEDAETGEIYKVVPEKMTFVPVQTKLK